MKREMLTSYIAGYFLSLLLTVAAYLAVVYRPASHMVLVGEIMALALAQLVIQLIFFLHLGKEKSPRWNLITFLFAAVVVVILAGGSLWIMRNLNYNMAQPSDSYIIHDEGIQP